MQAVLSISYDLSVDFMTFRELNSGVFPVASEPFKGRALFSYHHFPGVIVIGYNETGNKIKQ